jgi:hypothetical protein
MAFAVDNVSSDIKKSLTADFPLVREPSMSDLCEMDLSPGGVISPLSCVELPLITWLGMVSFLIYIFETILPDY